MVDGILNISKPRGKTSFGVVAAVKRLTGERRVGHAGTLDPEATGVLPICLGRGTRVTEFLLDTTKAYRAQIELGVATDTYDGTGRITQVGDPSGVSWEQLESALASFCGLIQQTPPMYSAVKHQGRRLYRLARAGVEIERRSRPARIYHVELIDWQPPVVTTEVVCGKGTYIRSIAHDLGQALSCGANLRNLIRTRYGLFDIKDAISLSQLETACRYNYWRHFVYPPDIVLLNWAAVIVNDDTGQLVRNGLPLVLKNDATKRINRLIAGSSCESCCRVYTLDGCFLGMLRFNPEREQWQPEKVFV